MNVRSDMPRLAASLGVLGTELEQKGVPALDALYGWKQGPSKVASPGERGGGGSEVAAEDRRAERAEARRAAVHHDEFVADLVLLNAVVQRINRRMDLACPPDMSEVKNRKTGEIAPETAGDIAAAGYCVSCWRNDKQMVVREKSKGIFVSATLCRWCMDVKRTYDVEPPLEVLKLHHAGRRISVQVMEAAIAKVKPPPKGKGKKRRKGKAA